MKLFSRKKSVSNSSSYDACSTTPSSLPPTTGPFERPSEPSTPLYERFARNRSLELPVNSASSPKAGSKADSLLDAPPTSYLSRNQSSNGSPTTLQSVSTGRHPGGIKSLSSEPLQTLPPISRLSKPESRRKASLPVKEISRPVVLNGTGSPQSTSSSKAKGIRHHRSNTVDERVSNSTAPSTLPPSNSSTLSRPPDSSYEPSLDTTPPSLTNGTANVLTPVDAFLASPAKARRSADERSKSRAQRSTESSHPSVAKTQAQSPSKRLGKRHESSRSLRPDPAPRTPSIPPAELLAEIPKKSSISTPSNQNHTPAATATITISTVYHSSPTHRNVSQSLNVLPPPSPFKPPNHNTPPVSGSPLTKRHSHSQAGENKPARSLGSRAPSPASQPPITYDLVSNRKNAPVLVTLILVHPLSSALPSLDHHRRQCQIVVHHRVPRKTLLSVTPPHHKLQQAYNEVAGVHKHR